MNGEKTASALFDLEAVFEVDDYLFVYGDDLTDERSGRRSRPGTLTDEKRYWRM